MLAAPYVAEVVIPFLLEERIVSITPKEAKARRLSLLLDEREKTRRSTKRKRENKVNQRIVGWKRGRGGLDKPEKHRRSASPKQSGLLSTKRPIKKQGTH
jgi:hypothetical protein